MTDEELKQHDLRVIKDVLTYMSVSILLGAKEMEKTNQPQLGAITTMRVLAGRLVQLSPESIYNYSHGTTQSFMDGLTKGLK
jgi:hypothetical protein